MFNIRDLFVLGIKLNRYQRRSCDDSKPNFLKNFSLEVKRMAPVTANAALYWKLSSFEIENHCNFGRI